MDWLAPKKKPAAAQCSRLVTHGNTLWPLRCLSARIGRDAEGSSRYGRRWNYRFVKQTYTQTWSRKTFNERGTAAYAHSHFTRILWILYSDTIWLGNITKDATGYQSSLDQPTQVGYVLADLGAGHGQNLTLCITIILNAGYNAGLLLQRGVTGISRSGSIAAPLKLPQKWSRELQSRHACTSVPQYIILTTERQHEASASSIVHFTIVHVTTSVHLAAELNASDKT